jgi:recombinational DNA repair protein RecT
MTEESKELQPVPQPDPTTGTLLARLSPEQKQRLADLARGDTEARDRIIARAMARFASEVSAGGAIAACEPRSVVMALAGCIALDLEPQFGAISSRMADVIILPRRDRDGRTVANAQVTATGLAKLAARDGYTITAQPIYAQDAIAIDLGALTLSHEPSLAGGDLVGAWAKFYRDGVCVHIELLRGDDLAKIRDSSDAWKRQGQGSPWGKWPERMAVKSAIARGVRHLHAPAANLGTALED